MELSAFRNRLLNGEVNLTYKESLIKEYEHLASLVPKSAMDRFKFDTSKFANMSSGKKTLIIILLIIFLPIEILLLIAFFPILAIGILIMILFRNASQSPEYKNYDFQHKIVEPFLKLYDDKLYPNYTFSSLDLVNSDMKYEDALVETHLIHPQKKKFLTKVDSPCSYDWNNIYNTDSFEFSGYRIYSEWVDEDGCSHDKIYFNGALYKFHTSFFMNGTLNIVSKSSTNTWQLGEDDKNCLEAIKLGNMRITDRERQMYAGLFDTFPTYPEEAYRYLTSNMMAALILLRNECPFSLFIKGNVMTVAVDKEGFRDAKREAIKLEKPYFAPKNPRAEMDEFIQKGSKVLLSIYELKDILDPGGMSINRG